MSDRLVTLTIDEAVAILRPLEEVVVSLDRLLSRASFGADVEPSLTEYFSTGGAGVRLAEGRRLLSVLLDRQVGEEAVTGLLGDLPYWTDRP